MTIQEALSRQDRIRYNLVNREDKEAVELVFNALRNNGVMYVLVNTPPEDAQTIDTGVPLINAQRIRSMTDEELAMFLEKVGYDSMEHRSTYWSNWLKQPCGGE